MQSHRKPVQGEFLVRPLEEVSEKERLAIAEEFFVESAPGIKGAFIARSRQVNLSEAAMRERLYGIAGKHFKILNILADSDGQKLFPTGNINVLLARPASEARLQSWLESSELRLVSKSKWRPLSITVSPVSVAEPLHRVAERLCDDPFVEVAEQEVLASFKRE